MTREEAIRIIKIVLVVAEDFEITVQGEKFTEEKCKEAVDMAIEELEQEPCTDAISRQAVLEVIEKCHCEEWIKADIGAPIEALQPVNSVEKPNRWIPVESALPEDGKRVIWCFKDGAIGIERYKCDAIDHFYPQQGQHGLEEAVAWMPLPERYKASPTGEERSE